MLRRLPRRLLVDLPGQKEREAILRILLKHEKLGDDVDLKKIAEQTDTYSGSDLKRKLVRTITYLCQILILYVHDFLQISALALPWLP